jgi:hypothetical protein
MKAKPEQHNRPAASPTFEAKARIIELDSKILDSWK